MDDNKFFQSLIDAITLPIFYKDKNGTYLGCNKAFEMFLDLPKEKIINNTVYDISPKDLAKIYELKDKELIDSKGVQEYESSVEHADGTRSNVLFKKSIFKDEKGDVSGLIGIIIDITDKKQFENLLVNAVNDWKYTFDAITDSVSIMDNDFNIVKVNKAFLDLFKLKEDQVIGKKCYEIVHRTNQPIDNCPHTKTIASKKAEESELAFSLEGPFVSVTTSPIFDKDNNFNGVVHIIHDITKRKKTENELRESEQKLKAILDNIEIGVALISPDMEIISLNKKMKSWFPGIDVSKKPICYKAFNNPPRDEKCGYCPTILSLKDGQVHEAITETPTGEKIVNFRIVSSVVKDEKGNIIAAIEMVEDVTKRIKAEIAQNRLASIIDNSEDAIIGKDLNGNILSWNKGAEKIYGYTTEEIMGKHITKIVPPEKAQEIEIILDKVKKGESIIRMETIRLTKKNMKIDVSLTISPIVDAEKKIIGASVITRDITEQKKLEKELKKRIDSLERFQKITIGRELRMKELKEEIKSLKSKP